MFYIWICVFIYQSNCVITYFFKIMHIIYNILYRYIEIEMTHEINPIIFPFVISITQITNVYALTILNQNFGLSYFKADILIIIK